MFLFLLQVLMSRPSDVRLALGFHCVVNRSQKNIDEQMSRKELWAKEKGIFTNSNRMKKLPEDNWGTMRLMEKVAKIQEARVDECLPKIKEAVRRKTVELREELRQLPVQAETKAEQLHLFNGILVRIRDDLVRRIRAEFISDKTSDRELTIAPIVDSMVQKFRKELEARNPDWLGQEMIDRVTDKVETFVQGHTVDNLIGPQVFINLIKQIFIEEGLLKESVNDLITEVGEHLRRVVEHVIEIHGSINGVLPSRLDAKAEECIHQLTVTTQKVCEMLAEAQQVTSTTHRQYMVILTHFQKSWFQQSDADFVMSQAHPDHPGGQIELPAEFWSLVKNATREPAKLAVLELAASLHVYTGFMIEGFAEMAAKLIKFNMVEQLAEKLEELWRNQFGESTLPELFPRDDLAWQKQDLEEKIKVLSEFKARGRVNFFSRETRLLLRLFVLPTLLSHPAFEKQFQVQTWLPPARSN